MGFIRKTLWTIVGVPAAALGAEYFYTIKVRETEVTDRLPKYSTLAARRLAENKAALDRFERVVPLSSLTASIGDVDENTLARRLAKQVWLTRMYTPQRKICERVFKDKREPDANLTYEEIKRAKIQPGFDISQHMFISDIVGTYIQFVPKVPPAVDFHGPGGVVCFDVEKRGDNVVFAIESATIGVAQTGPRPIVDHLIVWGHRLYAQVLLESAVRRILKGEGE
jgi:hypothetical protein